MQKEAIRHAWKNAFQKPHLDTRRFLEAGLAQAQPGNLLTAETGSQEYNPRAAARAGVGGLVRGSGVQIVQLRGLPARGLRGEGEAQPQYHRGGIRPGRSDPVFLNPECVGGEVGKRGDCQSSDRRRVR